MGVRITYNEGFFFGRAEFHERKLLEDAKFKFDKKLPMPWRFYSANPMSASLLRDYCDERAKIKIESLFIKRTPWKGALLIPKGKKLKEFQGPSIRFMLSQSRAYLGADPGLGKTIMAAILAATLGQRVLYVCPPFLTLNVQEEFFAWAPNLSTVTLDKASWDTPDVLIVPDTMIGRKDVIEYIKANEPKVLFGDEFHRFKSLDSDRTSYMLGANEGENKEKGLIHLPSLERIYPLSGTPMPNRPVELYPMLYKLAPETINFMSLEQYGKRYCGARHNGYAYEYKGASNMKELRERTLTTTWEEPGFVLRLYKDRLGLPPVVPEVVVLGRDMPTELSGMERDIQRRYSPEDFEKASIAYSVGKEEDDLHFATYQRLLGLSKVKPVAEFLNAQLEETEERFLIFGIHTEVIAELANALKAWCPLIITGKVPVSKRQGLVREFQTNPLRRLFLGNLDAMGVGFNLTKASQVGFIEWSWGGYVNRQGIDRVHRIGYEGETLLARFFAFRNSIDFTKLNTVQNKDRITAFI